jgi:hypothetical protein
MSYFLHYLGIHFPKNMNANYQLNIIYFPTYDIQVAGKQT